MKFFNVISILAALFLSQTGHANTWYDRGNGGLVVVCENKEPEVLDLYEARTRHLLDIKSVNEATWQERAQVLINRLRSVDHARFQNYSDELAKFSDSLQFVAADLLTTPDAGLVTLGAGCFVKQAVFQRDAQGFNSARYVIDSRLWQKLDDDGKAALALHEIIYKEFVDANVVNISSERVRFFNALIHADAVSGLSVKNYVQLLQRLKFLTYSYRGVNLQLGEILPTGAWVSSRIRFFSPELIEKAPMVANQLLAGRYFNYTCANSAIAQLGFATFTLDGAFKSVVIPENFREASGCELPYFLYQDKDSLFKVSGNNWTFFENGQPQEVQGVDSNLENFEMLYRGLHFSRNASLNSQAKLETNFVFDPNMNLMGLSLGGYACRKNETLMIRADGYFTSTYMSLSAAGRVISPVQPCLP